MRIQCNKIVISECLCRRPSVLKRCKVTGFPTQALLQAPALRSKEPGKACLKSFQKILSGMTTLFKLTGQQ